MKIVVLTPKERQEVGRAYIGVASFFSDKPVVKDTVSIWLDAVSDLPAQSILGALKKWFNDPKALRAPTPGQIREIISPTLDDRTVALDASSRVVSAVPKFGWAQSRAAREFIGELGWSAVERLGGWAYLCEHLGTKGLPVTTVQAQVRDLCEARVKMAKAGRDMLPPGIPKLELNQGEAREVVALIESKATNKPEEGKE